MCKARTWARPMGMQAVGLGRPLKQGPKREAFRGWGWWEACEGRDLQETFLGRGLGSFSSGILALLRAYFRKGNSDDQLRHWSAREDFLRR